MEGINILDVLLPPAQLPPARRWAPFPWFGGKKQIAAAVWQRLGRVQNYVEPFFGSGAVLLANPCPPNCETVCDADHFVANFWRAVRGAPDELIEYADRPVSEVDLHIQHHWLVTEGATRLERLEVDRDYFCPEVAGRWVWGACAWIGKGWCSGRGPWRIEAGEWVKGGNGVGRQLPHLGDYGRGINRQLPHIGNRGRGVNRLLPAEVATRREFIATWVSDLAHRMRDVRVACGNWDRVLGPSITTRLGVTGVFLDPPYSTGAGRDQGVYRKDCGNVAVEAARWAVANGEHPKMRIAFAGYEGEHTFPPGWTTLRWQTVGGYGMQGQGTGRANRDRETVWFSPNCEAGI